MLWILESFERHPQKNGNDAQLIDRQFQCATAKNCNDFLRRKIQYFPGAEKLHHVLRSLQHVINDNEHLAKIFPTPPLLTFKQPSNLKQTIVCSKLPNLQDNINRNTIQPYHGNLCKTCQVIATDSAVT
eukprot:g23489.t1